MEEARKSAKWIWSRLGDLSLLQWLFSGVGAVTSGLLSWMQSLPYALWLVNGAAVFCLLAMGQAYLSISEGYHSSRTNHQPDKHGDPVKEAIERLGPNPLGKPEIRVGGMQYRARPDDRKEKWKRDIIDNGRTLAILYREGGFEKPFQDFVSRERAYLDIQPHLGEEYFSKVIHRNEFAKDTPEARDIDSALFLRELARLEKEWSLS